ncbi:MAG: hypothetical protein ACJAZ2_000918 [Glaciecola sp.]|jgi:hypothetical protein
MKLITRGFLIMMFLFCTGVQLQAQKIDWGTEQVSKSKYYLPHIIGEDEEAVYSYSYERNTLIVEKFSKDKFKRVYKTQFIKPKINKRRIVIESLILMGDHFVVLASYYDKKTKQNTIVFYKIDKSNGKIVDGHKELFSIDVEKKRRRGTFNVRVTEDDSKILIQHTGYYKKKDRVIATFKLFNADLEVIEEFTEDFKKRDKENSIDYISNLVIDNDGSIFYLKLGFENYTIVSLDANKGYEKWEDRVDIEELEPRSVISHLRFTFDKKGDLVLFGFYNERKKGLKGVYFSRINNLTKEIEVSKLSKFDADFLDQFRSERQKKKAAKGKKAKDGKLREIFNLIEILPKEDGGIAVVAESYTYSNTLDYGSVGISNDNEIREKITYGNMLAINLSSSGEMLWAKFLPKNQYFYQQSVMRYFIVGTHGFSFYLPVNSYNYTKYYSYVAAMDKQDLIIMFNEHKNNKLNDLKTKKKGMQKVKKSRPVAYLLNLETGDINMKDVKNGVSQKTPLAPEMSYKTKDGKMIIVFGQKKKKFTLGKYLLD